MSIILAYEQKEKKNRKVGHIAGNKQFNNVRNNLKNNLRKQFRLLLLLRRAPLNECLMLTETTCRASRGTLVIWNYRYRISPE